ncbi:MAG: zinc dependent phospholipase C family protein [Clostridia bacterium]
MPDILAHAIFCQEVCEGLDDINIKSILNENFKLYTVGSQGPDIFFYYKPVLPTEKIVNDAGYNMHNANSSAFFIDAIRKLETMQGREYETFLSYIFGFISHFYLDKKISPYLAALEKSGAFRFNGDRTGISLNEAQSLLDARLWQVKKGTDSILVDNSALINMTALPDTVIEHFIEYFEKAHDIYLCDYHITGSLKSMVKVLRFLYDPGNKKKKFVDFVERIIGEIKIPKKRFSLENSGNIDILNLGRHEWGPVRKDGTVSAGRVEDLLDEAREECINCLNNISRHLENGEHMDVREALSELGNLTDVPGGQEEQPLKKRMIDRLVPKKYNAVN